MPWFASTLESFAVTHVRPAPPARVDARRTQRPHPQPASRPDSERGAAAR